MSVTHWHWLLLNYVGWSIYVYYRAICCLMVYLCVSYLWRSMCVKICSAVSSFYYYLCLMFNICVLYLLRAIWCLMVNICVLYLLRAIWCLMVNICVLYLCRTICVKLCGGDLLRFSSIQSSKIHITGEIYRIIFDWPPPIFTVRPHYSSVQIW